MVRGCVAAVVIGMVVVPLAGCTAAGETSSRSAPSTPTSPSTSSTSAWLAVVTSSADPNDLDRPRADVVTALGSNDPRVVVSPGACFTGIAERYAARYVLALAESSRARVQELARRAETDLEWIGPVTSTCID